jgi:hypothetical protein
MIKYYVCYVCMCVCFFNTFTSSYGEREGSALQTGLSKYNSLRPILLTFFCASSYSLGAINYLDW